MKDHLVDQDQILNSLGLRKETRDQEAEKEHETFNLEVIDLSLQQPILKIIKEILQEKIVILIYNMLENKNLEQDLQ